jgi:hypothetical protein
MVKISGSTVYTTMVVVGPIEPSYLIVDFDINVPAGTEARAEASIEPGAILSKRLAPKLFILSTDIEVTGEVYALIDDEEKRIVTIDENQVKEIDVDEEFGGIAAEKLILLAKTKSTTSALRRVSLYYTGNVVEYRPMR